MIKRKKILTKEPQYNDLIKSAKKFGISKFGIMANQSWNEDPKRTIFTLARYKFVAKMLSGKKNVLEVGCADAFGTRIVQQEVKKITALDFDPIFIQDAEDRKNKYWPMDLFVHDMLSGPFNKSKFDAAFCLDVLEHINKKNENKFMKNLLSSLTFEAPLIIGIPSKESQAFASKQSKLGHVNCKSGDKFKSDLEKYFKNVFVFSMNDEVVHTGFYKMAHYLIAICTTRK